MLAVLAQYVVKYIIYVTVCAILPMCSEPCNMGALAHATVGNCYSGGWPHGTYCNQVCDAGYTRFGAAYYCFDGGISQGPQVCKSQDNKLSSYVLSAGGYAYGPGWSSTTYSYSVTVAWSVSSVTVWPTLSYAAASQQISLNGAAYGGLCNGCAYSPGINVGDNTIRVYVTSEDGLYFNTYTINMSANMLHSYTCLLSAYQFSASLVSLHMCRLVYVCPSSSAIVYLMTPPCPSSLYQPLLEIVLLHHSVRVHLAI
jgi:hypothetical protein